MCSLNLRSLGGSGGRRKRRLVGAQIEFIEHCLKDDAVRGTDEGEEEMTLWKKEREGGQKKEEKRVGKVSSRVGAAPEDI